MGLTEEDQGTVQYYMDKIKELEEKRHPQTAKVGSSLLFNLGRQTRSFD